MTLNENVLNTKVLYLIKIYIWYTIYFTIQKSFSKL